MISCFSLQPVPRVAGTYPKKPYVRHVVEWVLLSLSEAGYGTSLATAFSMRTAAANPRTEPALEAPILGTEPVPGTNPHLVS